MALTLHKCPRCGQCYYDGTPHQCPPPPSPPPPPRSPAANDDVYLLYAVLLGLIGGDRAREWADRSDDEVRAAAMANLQAFADAGW